jgi:Holliday junction resolvasome RuvABC endonuclease subunit
MPPKKKLLRTPAKRRDSAKSRESGLSRRLDDLTEQIEIMVPEVTARVAALEHILLRKQLCTREDLFRAREFIRIQEG